LIANDTIGSFALQHILTELSHPKEKELIIQLFTQNFKELVSEKHGIHLLEKLLTYYDDSMLSDIYQIIIDNFQVYVYNPLTLCLVSYCVKLKLFKGKKSNFPTY
jgi:hypothetical protein